MDEFSDGTNIFAPKNNPGDINSDGTNIFAPKNNPGVE
jgi:hypothetical protein